MRVTVSHNKTAQEVTMAVDRGFDQIFTGLPIAALEFSNQQRTWNGRQMDFSFTARAGFLNVPVKGLLVVEDRQVIIDIELPEFLRKFLPEHKVQAAVESRVKGLLS